MCDPATIDSRSRFRRAMVNNDRQRTTRAIKVDLMSIKNGTNQTIGSSLHYDSLRAHTNLSLPILEDLRREPETIPHFLPDGAGTNVYALRLVINTIRCTPLTQNVIVEHGRGLRLLAQLIRACYTLRLKQPQQALHERLKRQLQSAYITPSLVREMEKLRDIHPEMCEILVNRMLRLIASNAMKKKEALRIQDMVRTNPDLVERITRAIQERATRAHRTMKRVRERAAFLKRKAHQDEATWREDNGLAPLPEWKVRVKMGTRR